MSTSHSHSHDHHDHDHEHDHSHHHHDHGDSLLAPNTKLSLVIPWKVASSTYDQVLKRQAQHVKAAGFRKGKVPTKLAEEIIGQDKLIDATINQLLPAAYPELIKKEQRRPLTQPDIRPIKLALGEDWEFEVQIGERPEIKVTKYQTAVAQGRKAAQAEIKKLNQERAEAAKKAGQSQSKTKKATDPQSPETPTEPLTKDKEEEITLRSIFRALVDQLKPAIPELIVREETRRELEQLVKSLEQFKFTLDDYLKRRGQTFEQLSGEIAATMLGQIQIEFILDALAEQEKITVTNAEIDKVGERIEDPATREKQLKNEQYRHYVRHQLRRQKVTELLLKA